MQITNHSTLQDRKGHTFLSTKQVHKVDISDPLSFTDSIGIILSYLTVKELLSLHCVNESWYQLLTLQNVKNHYSIEYYSECIFNTIIKIANPLLVQPLYSINDNDHDNDKFGQKSDSIKYDHFHQLHLSNITKTHRNKFMKYTLPLIGKIAHVALMTSKIQYFEENDSDDSDDSNDSEDGEDVDMKQHLVDNEFTIINEQKEKVAPKKMINKCNSIVKQQQLRLQQEKRIWINIHDDIFKFIQLNDFFNSIAQRLILMKKNNGNFNYSDGDDINESLSQTRSRLRLNCQFSQQLLQIQCFCDMMKVGHLQISRNNIIYTIYQYISQIFPSVVQYVETKLNGTTNGTFGTNI